MPIRKTQEEFIAQARSVHGDKYDYSKVKYVNSSTKVCIICPEHGEFWQVPNLHTSQKCGCPECGKVKEAQSRTWTTERFIEEARKVHGDRYDYSKTIYTRSSEKLCIICKEHGEFWMAAANHLGGQNCTKCSKHYVPTTEEFIAQAREVHGDRYDYSKTVYVKRAENVCIICPEHGEFWQSPGNHIGNRNGCPKCAGHARLTTTEFIQAAKAVHGDLYDYSKVEYKNNSSPVCIICKKHGEFWQAPNTHTSQKCGCPKCGAESISKSKTKDLEHFLKKAHEVHGDRYDYSKAVYRGATTKLCIICKKHGEFWQTPSNHMNGQNCWKCANEENSMHQPKSTEQFIIDAKAVHGDKYDYSKTVYRGTLRKLCVICPEHGEFWPTATNHLGGSICPKCAGRYQDQDYFIECARKVHGDKFDYSKVEYLTSKSKVCIICPEHGEFWQKPNGHLLGSGCPRCAQRYSPTTAEFVERAREVHGDKYDYSLVEYVNSSSRIKIICPIHGPFLQVAGSHLQGYNCPKCSHRFMDTELYIETANKKHHGKYDYSKVEYTGAFNPVTIICPKHGEFEQIAHTHLHGNGCPICAESHLERQVRGMLKRHNIDFKAQHKFEWLVYKKKMPLDFYLPEYNLAIECQGLQHFEVNKFFGGETAFEYEQNRDRAKRELCAAHGIKILYYSDLEINYPYDVIEGTDNLLRAIEHSGKADKPVWQPHPELPLEF